MAQRFLQLHLLTSYPAALLNRDDAGFAKRLPFGGTTRTRISSQCLKRHWRTHEGEFSLKNLGVDMAVRSRLTFQKYIYEPLLADGVSEALAQAITRELMAMVLGKSPKAKGKGEEEVSLQTNQITVFGRPELEWLLAEGRAIAAENPDPKKVGEAFKNRFGKDGKRNIEALAKAASGLDAALFGRMVTSDILARGDAAVHVAHAFTVHAEHSESDYFSAVDDLLQEEAGLGSGHINSTELTSGLYYTYLVVDLPLLVSNLEGCQRSEWESADRTLAARVLESLIQIVATVSPGAKLGSTAPHAYAHMVLAEMGNAQPRTLANAFLSAVKTSANAPALLENTYRALGEHLSELDRMYGRRSSRKLAAIGPVEGLVHAVGVEEVVSLHTLANWVAQEVQGAGHSLAQV